MMRKMLGAEDSPGGRGSSRVSAPFKPTVDRNGQTDVRFPQVGTIPGGTRPQSLLPVVLAALAMTLLLTSVATATEPSDVVSTPTGNLFKVLQDGGPILVPLGLCSFLLTLFSFERAIALRRGRVIPRPFVRRILSQIEDNELDRKQALRLCRESRSPISDVFAAALIKWGRPAVEVEQAILDAGERASYKLRRYLRLFNGIGTISPLLGLLGTVMGMIQAFNSIADTDAMGKPELLASGISEALITTAAGLTVAIPAIVVYLYFSSRVDKLVTEIDGLGQRLVNAIASDGWKDTEPEITNRSNKKKAA